jgi:ferrochelatase
VTSKLAEPAVLLMAYGTPEREADIEAYLADIRHGRSSPPAVVEDLKQRYRRIGGHSPLLEITNAQAAALQKTLLAQGVKVRVYVGMKHWHPYIREVVPQILQNNHNRLVALVMAPHYSEMSVGGYRRALDEALGQDNDMPVDFIETWYDNPLFHQAVGEKVTEALQGFPAPAEVQVLFTAHSLPERILEQHDPYPNQLRASCQAVASIMKLDHWSFAYQSAGQTAEKWLGPDILQTLNDINQKSKSEKAHVLVVPIGFVADHLEILYDIDIEAREFAQSHGLNLRRTESLNTSPRFITTLANIVSRRL